MIALPVLNRVVAIPFASDGSTLKVAITDPQDVRGLDELRLATRLSVEFYVAAKSDVLTELRRLSRAAEAMNATFAEEMAGVGGRGGGRRRPRGRRRHLRRAARPPRQLDDLRSRRGRGERHPRRAAGGRSRRPLPDRRRPPRRPPHSEAAGLRRDDPPQGACEARHRRAAQAAGRADLAQRRGRGTDARHPRGDAPHGRGRGGHHAPPRQVARGADARVARPLRPDERADGCDPRPADGGAPRHRADRIGQVDDALRGAERDQPAGDQHHHRRGSRRVSARRRQPGADQPSRRAELCHGAALDRSLRPRRDHGRRDPRRRDRTDLDRGRADGSLRALDAAHERRAVRDHAADRDGRRAVPDRCGRLGGPGAAPGEEAVPALRRAVHCRRSTSCTGST